MRPYQRRGEPADVFESLSDKLTSVFDRLRGKGRLSEQDVNDALREVRMALLEADVNFRIVKDFVARIKERAVGTDVIETLTGPQTVVKIVAEELQSILGGDAATITFQPKPPTIIMMCGLQGSGKTTSTGKLAAWVRKQGRNPLLVACDVYRPAAITQLQVLGRQLNLPVFAPGADVRPPEIARRAVTHAAQNGCDVILLDTAGRLHIDDALMDELSEIKRTVQPHEILLVVDAMTGQDAVTFAEAFHSRLAVDGVVMTKLDGDARGGAALSIRGVLGVPIKFIGVGEKLDALEPFHPNRMAQRILGMGDVLSLIERAQETIDQKKAEEMERRLRQNRFDLNDFLAQLEQMKKLGPLENIVGMLPGMGRIKDQLPLAEGEKILARQKALVLSMTPAERAEPALLNGSRKRRVALGAGLTVQELNQFLTQFDQMRQMIRKMMGSEGAFKQRLEKRRKLSFRR
jgi:signal recognition particle subunit SRP54